jgi:hypothetical protein
MAPTSQVLYPLRLIADFFVFLALLLKDSHKYTLFGKISEKGPRARRRGPFSEIFPKRVYLWESFNKREKKTKKSVSSSNKPADELQDGTWGDERKGTRWGRGRIQDTAWSTRGGWGAPWRGNWRKHQKRYHDDGARRVHWSTMMVRAREEDDGLTMRWVHATKSGSVQCHAQRQARVEWPATKAPARRVTWPKQQGQHARTGVALASGRAAPAWLRCRSPSPFFEPTNQSKQMAIVAVTN